MLNYYILLTYKEIIVIFCPLEEKQLLSYFSYKADIITFLVIKQLLSHFGYKEIIIIFWL